MSEQRTGKRMRDEPVHKPKAVPFGDTIVYDAERCIACTRCIRVCDELVGRPHARPARARQQERGGARPGPQARGRLHPHDRARLPRRRAHLEPLPLQGPGVDAQGDPLGLPGCATGCNMWLDVDPREQRAYRNRPRDNPAVNKFWMCDDGMMTYEREHEARVTRARVGREARGRGVGPRRRGEQGRRVSSRVSRARSPWCSRRSTAPRTTSSPWSSRKALDAPLYLSAKAPWRATRSSATPTRTPTARAPRRGSGAKVGSLQGPPRAAVAAGR
jgi:ferredoxin